MQHNDFLKICLFCENITWFTLTIQSLEEDLDEPLAFLTIPSKGTILRLYQAPDTNQQNH